MLKLHETELITNIARNLLSAKHVHYQQQYIHFRLLENMSYRCLPLHVQNWNRQKIKASVFVHTSHPLFSNSNNSHKKNSHRNSMTNNQTDDYQKQQNNSNESSLDHDKICIIYLHGFGSHRLEGTTLIHLLSEGIGLCCFDFSGSGKSQGDLCTYGLREYKDIDAVIEGLKHKFGYDKFVLWGRSMGATASLLYTCSPQTNNNNQILFQVLDSPFSSFTDIATHHARASYSLPQFVITIALDILNQHFKTHEYNPFTIDIPSIAHRCTVPSLFMYCQQDTIIPSTSSTLILQKFNSNAIYEKLVIQQNHNSFRSKDTLQKCMDILNKYIIDGKVKCKVKHKKGIHKLFSFPITPTYKTAGSLEMFEANVNSSGNRKQEYQKRKGLRNLGKFINQSPQLFKDQEQLSHQNLIDYQNNENIRVMRLSGCGIEDKNKRKNATKINKLIENPENKQNSNNSSTCFGSCSGKSQKIEGQ